MSRTGSVLLFAAALAMFSAQAKDAPTVGSVTENNGLTKSGRLIVKTTSILSTKASEPVPPDIRLAIDSYDRVIELPADPRTRAEAMRRSAYLRLQLVDRDEAGPADLQKAITTYEQLLAEIPDDSANDRALYQLSRAYQLAGQDDKAIDTLRTLGRKYPQSLLTADALFRSAELLFVRGRYAEAEREYKTVLAFGEESGFFEPAQYKYGWALYKQSAYELAVPVFLAILDRELPRGSLGDPDAAMAYVKNGKSELAADALRVTSLSFAAMGGGPAMNDYFTKAGAEPRFATLLYDSLGAMLIEKQRYTDAAGVYSAFIDRYPAHLLAPKFQSRAIEAYQQGGFGDQVVSAKERYVELYAPGAAYWSSGRQPDATMLAELRKHLDELGRHYQARAQQRSATEVAARRADFLKAAGWYRRTLDLFPQDPQAASLNLLYADALFDGGETAEAAQQYQKVAYGYGTHAKAPEAAYATVQAWQRLATEAPAKRGEALQQSVVASLKLADSFPEHPQWPTVLSQAADNLFELKDYPQVIVVSGRVLARQALPPQQRRQNLALVSDSHFALKQYPEAERSYAELLKLIDPTALPQRRVAVEQLAASVYRQGEAAREAGDLRAAATAFQRVGQVAPDASIRASAEYDAASAFFELQDWRPAQTSLETFRQRYPAHALVADADKKLAVAYQKDNRLQPAADTYFRIAQRPAESLETRREAAWLAAELYDQVRMPPAAQRAYEYWLANFGQPYERAMQARQRLSEIALEFGRDPAKQQHWWRELVKADAAGGGARTPATRLLAARASLELAKLDVASARGLPLTLPIAKSLPQRKAAMETAIASLGRAASYNIAEISTAATYELGGIYRDFAAALLKSQRPPELRDDALEQYNILLEEQAYPFEEKAAKAYEQNLQRVKQGLWDDWIRRSVKALGELDPVKYGKRDQRETIYEAIR